MKLTTDNVGTCFLKGGEVKKSDAYYVHNFKSTCGFCETCLGDLLY